jgi:D-alanyl-lipoteichoic acid acyltransferase DltB (MBOAT superfamily)
MNFASLQFIAFLGVVLAAYHLLARRTEAQNLLLLVASYYFYACWDPRFLALIWFITGTSFFAARLVAGTPDMARRRRWLALYVVIALSTIGYFKYFNFFIDSARLALTQLGVQVNPLYLEILLPPAISFYVFESICYVVEVHKGRLPADTRLRHYALFIAYFPKLVAGPIERPAVLIPQIQAPRTLTDEMVSRGVFLILLGLLKKIVVADGMAPVVDSVFDRRTTPGATDIVLASYAFALQIYCDFSGYTDIARGVSKLMGIELSQNFRFPYFSSNASEFWRRWHISLSSWLRDYLYIPLGGNRVGRYRKQANLMLTMLLGGLWHGAAWNYILWGAYQGSLLVAHHVWASITDKARLRLPHLVAALVFFQFVCYGWLLFRARSFDQIADFTRQLFTGPYSLDLAIARPSFATLLGVVVLLAYDLAGYRSGTPAFYQRWPVVLRALLYAAMLVLVLMGLANARSAFIYFQF